MFCFNRMYVGKPDKSAHSGFSIMKKLKVIPGTNTLQLFKHAKN